MYKLVFTFMILVFNAEISCGLRRISANNKKINMALSITPYLFLTVNHFRNQPSLQALSNGAT